MNMVFTSPLTDLYGSPEAGERTDQALCGMTASVLRRQGEWCFIETGYGYRGWVQRTDLRAVAEPVAWNLAPKRIVVRAAADLLSQPRVQGTCVATMLRGCIVGALQNAGENGWQRVCLPGGESGWMPACFLKKLPAAETVPEDELRQSLIKAALSYSGVQYRWGGKSPLGIDCSGLMQMAYLLNGILIWRDAKIQEGYAVHRIGRSAVQPADLLYFPGHVAMYIGSGKYVHSTGRKGDSGVTLNSLDPKSDRYRKDLDESLLTAGTVFPLSGSACFHLQ
ncbi:MAG: C40 family peptidase [Oscillospiraceae bacterium]|nr:C40 family peptidase [Oscillospiraceae bacterium]